MDNIADFVPVLVALISVIGARILEHYIGKRARRTKESAELKKADLERDKFIVDKALEMLKERDVELLRVREENRILREELSRENIDANVG